MTLDPRITFARTSIGTYYGSDGLLKYAGHNLVFPSEDFSSANWSKQSGATVTTDLIAAPNATTTADRLNHVTAGTVVGGFLQYTVGAVLQINRFIVSIYAKAGSKNWLVLSNNAATTRHCWFNLASGVVGTRDALGWVSAGILDVGGGWYRCWGLSVAAAGFVHVRVGEADNTLNCTSPGDIYIWGAQVEAATIQGTPDIYRPTTTVSFWSTPRFDYDPVSHAPRGIMVEQIVNVQTTWPQDFTQAVWAKTGATVTADQTTAPDGTTTADRIASSATPASVANTTSTGTGIPYTQSFYARKGTSDWVYTIVQSTGDAVGTPRAWFNLATGAVGTVEAGITATTIQDVGGGWYRCSATRIGTTGTSRVFSMGPCDADNSTAVTVGRTIFLWGAQLETAIAFPTSYVPGAGSTISRAADILTMTGTNFSSWYTQNVGTFIAEFELIAASGTRPILSADNNTANERIFLFGSGTDPKATINDGGVMQADLDLGTLSAGAPFKIGASVALNDVAGCFDGGTVFTDLAATMPTPTQLRLGSEGTNYLNGWLRKVKFYVVAKSDSELAVLTAGGSTMPPLTLAATDRPDALAGVGGAASVYPDSTNTGHLKAPGYPGSLSAQPGSITSGSTYSFRDFIDGVEVLSGITNVTFIGCRFRSNALGNDSGASTWPYNARIQGGNVTFSYCTFCPQPAKATAPPNAAWPAAGTGTTAWGFSGYATYQIGVDDGYQFAVACHGNGDVVVDHCDIWGFGNAIDCNPSSTSASITVSNSWLHDAANSDATPNRASGYHTDGPGYLDGGSAPRNIAIRNCTIASLGNTNAIAFQNASSGYQNIEVDGCYLSGFGITVDMCHNVSGNTGLKFTNNVITTAVRWGFRPLYADYTTQFSGSSPTNQWFNNKLEVWPGTSKSGDSSFNFTSGDNGKYLYPGSTLSTTDYVDGHP